ncbi:LysR family transcriptional regulator [Neobacillus niacini]|uniref:LysR family transcriptional regulator n=1 Tax=Neobacillus niacini TaxID=86668 RepID=UPI0021CB4FA0|nr:LysR family transcriptional regulator [Neobacillus niacini]MCM3765575.1 LysR family transcriptional regulator [Neobacillus niacini]
MNTHHLSVFKRVMEMGNISQVAKEIHVSQPAISMMLKRLEQDVGVHLYTVVGRNIAATDGGLTLLEYAETILSLEAQVYRAMEEFQEGSRGRIVVGTSQVLGTYLLPKMILSFNQSHSNITVDLEIREDQDIEGLVKTGNIDIGITLTPPVDHFSLRVSKISEDRLIGVQPPFPIDSKTIFISSDIPYLIDKLETKILFSTEAVKQFVIKGMGYGVVLKSAVELELSCGMLKYWDGYEANSMITNVITRPAERLSKSVWFFLYHLTEN